MSRTAVGKAFSPTIDANNAIVFNGSSQYGKLLNSAVIDALNGTSLTVEFWVYRNGNQPTANNEQFVLGSASAGQFSIFTDGTNYATIGGFVDYSGNDSYRYANTSYLSSATWTHEAFVFDAAAKTVTIYKDGAVYSGSVASQTGTGTMASPAGMDLFLGVNRVLTKFYKGSFACLRLWNSVRTAAEILANKNYYLDPSQESSALIVNCNIIEGSGTTVANTVSGGNSMALFGTPSWTTGPTLTAKNYNGPRTTAGERPVIGFSQDFQGFTDGQTFADLEVFGNMKSEFNGLGVNKIATVGGSKVIQLTPQVSTSGGETHGGLVTSPKTIGNIDFSVRVQTVSQLRTGSAPNARETAWVLWNYKDNTHFYYFALKTDEFELGKEDPAYAGNQRFLATGGSGYSLGTWYTVRVTQVGATITVRVDGNVVTTFTDAEAPLYTEGKVGLYTEDADVYFDDLTLTGSTRTLAS